MSFPLETTLEASNTIILGYRSRTRWRRLLPEPREADLTEGLRAEIADPLWMLTRQWQFREFQGEDAGSPTRADLHVERDHLTGYDLDPAGRRAESPGPQPYEDVPLEALVERETVGGRDEFDDAPPMRVATDAGLHFLRLLDTMSYRGESGEPYVATDFPATLRLSEPSEPLEAGDQRYVSVVADRALDGHAVFRRLSAAVPAIEADGTAADAWGTDGVDPPLPRGGEVTPAYREAAAAFHAWYRDLYFEPTADTGAAWRPERLEYGFAVSTGSGAGQTVFEAEDYQGGHLDWDAFSLIDGAVHATLGDDSGGGADDGDGASPIPEEGENEERTDTTTPSTHRVGSDVGRISLADRPAADEGTGPRTELGRRFRDADLPTEHATSVFETSTMPTSVTFPGMPASRFWEFEDSAVTLSRIAGDGASLPRSLLLEFAVQFGDDWFQIPIPTPLGTYSRVTSLAIDDTFGVSEDAVPVQRRTDDWNAFMFDPAAESDGEGDDQTPARPGLLLPPTLARSLSSEPLERVLFARDELANLAFGVEQLVESPVGMSVERGSFSIPRLAVDRVAPATTPSEEYVEFTNAGEDDLVIDGWAIEREAAGETEVVHRVEGLTLAPAARLRLYTAAPTEATTDTDSGTVVRDCGRDESLWTDATVLSVYALTDGGETDDGGATRRLVARHLLSGVTADAAYRIASEVPDHWFPLAMGHRAEEGEALDLDVDPGEYYLERGVLLDASSLGVDPAFLPTPEGRILDPAPEELRDADLPPDDAARRPFNPLRVFEEEIGRSGREVTRHHQLARWTNGEQYLWTGRRVTAGEGEGSSNLRFDFLEEQGSSGSTTPDDDSQTE